MGLRIQKGAFKGRLVPIPPSVRGHDSFTPSVFKSSVFDLIVNKIGSNLVNWNFVDLTLGSGQMAIEALSLGFKKVEGCELDNKRIRHLVEEFKDKKYEIKIHRRDFSRSHNLLLSLSPVVFFVDPPYSFWEGEHCKLLEQLITKLLPLMEKSTSKIFGLIQGPAPLCIVSSQKDNLLEKEKGIMNQQKEKIIVTNRKYGNQFLSIVEFPSC